MKDAIEEIMNDSSLSYEGRMLKLKCLQIQTLQNIADQKPREERKSLMSQDIASFHKKFDQEYTGEPRILPDDVSEFRLKFLEEELSEYRQSVKDKSIVEQVDGLFDLVYVALGTVYLMGVDIDEVWKEGHNSNMTKKVVKKGKGKMGFTVAKGFGYRRPNFQPMTSVNIKPITK